MPKPASGEVYWTADGAMARITLQGRNRRPFLMPTCRNDTEAKERAAVLATLAQRFRRAKLIGDPQALPILEMAAEKPAALLPGVLELADDLLGGKLPATASNVPTFGALAKRWTSGDLHRDFPDHVRPKDARLDGTRLEAIGAIDVGGIKLADVPIDRFRLDHAELAMRHLPDTAKKPATRRAYAQLIHRVLALAVYPCRLIPASPLPRGFMPKPGKPPARPYLYPDEDRKLLASSAPLCDRMLFGFLAREGMRSSEARALLWRELDLERGAVALDKNKTDDARAWALDPGVTAALRAYKARYRAGAKPDERVFLDAAGEPYAADKLAELLRATLGAAGIDRDELFNAGTNRGRMRAHDLRATFVTLNLAAGRSEAWIADRTGHTTSEMINRYRRAARSAKELGLGTLAPMVEAVPELDCPTIAPPPTLRGKRGAAKSATHKTKPKWRNWQTRRTQKAPSTCTGLHQPRPTRRKPAKARRPTPHRNARPSTTCPALPRVATWSRWRSPTRSPRRRRPEPGAPWRLSRSS